MWTTNSSFSDFSDSLNLVNSLPFYLGKTRLFMGGSNKGLTLILCGYKIYHIEQTSAVTRVKMLNKAFEVSKSKLTKLNIFFSVR